MERQFIEKFEGPQGDAEVWERVARDATGREIVDYEVVFAGQPAVVATMGEASVLASELSGDPRFSR